MCDVERPNSLRHSDCGSESKAVKYRTPMIGTTPRAQTCLTYDSQAFAPLQYFWKQPRLLLRGLLEAVQGLCYGRGVPRC